MYFCCYNYLPVLADYVIDLPLQNYIDANALPLHKYPKLYIEKLKNGDKIFVKTDYLPFFLINILPHINVEFILIKRPGFECSNDMGINIKKILNINNKISSNQIRNNLENCMILSILSEIKYNFKRMQ
jgi:hypothetical protein